MGMAHEVVGGIADEVSRLLGELFLADEGAPEKAWRGSAPWDSKTEAAYKREHPGAPLPAFADGLARPEQLLPGTPGAADPTEEWPIWYLRGGRGSGKTRPAAEGLAEWMLEEPGEYGVVAPTFGAVRDVCIEGPSGLIRALGGTNFKQLGPHIRRWNRSHGQMFLENGSVVYVDGADDGALRVQGKNLTGAW